ncbi:MAG: PAS domain-containing protein [Halofilum sp. (in: g-proteobacteria)]|nr:PAS domain-containing protein [Halofilum sp. (in: g-proteobacteria)]
MYVSSEFRLAWVNEEFTRLTGYTGTEVLGQPLRVLRSELHEQSYYDEMLDALAERGTGRARSGAARRAARRSRHC